MKAAEKGSCVVVLNRVDYLGEAKQILSVDNTYQMAIVRTKDLLRLVEESLYRERYRY